MKLRVISCQNAFLSGTPTFERKANPIETKLYHYVCQDENEPIRDYYDGFSYQNSIVIFISDLTLNQKNQFIKEFNARLNCFENSREEYLSKLQVDFIADKLLKELNFECYSKAKCLMFENSSSQLASQSKINQNVEAPTKNVKKNS